MEKKKVEEVIEDIRPQLQADGGDVELIDVDDDGTVKVKLIGACAGCPMSTLTISSVIEKTLKEKVPGVEKVETV